MALGRAPTRDGDGRAVQQRERPAPPPTGLRKALRASQDNPSPPLRQDRVGGRGGPRQRRGGEWGEAPAIVDQTIIQIWGLTFPARARMRAHIMRARRYDGIFSGMPLVYTPKLIPLCPKLLFFALMMWSSRRKKARGVSRASLLVWDQVLTGRCRSRTVGVASITVEQRWDRIKKVLNPQHIPHHFQCLWMKQGSWSGHKRPGRQPG